MSSEGTPLHGDRSAYNVMGFDTEHGKDIMDSTLRRHLPLPGAAGGIAQSDGTDWQRVNSLPLADLTDATRGCIIRRGASDWEAYDASTDGAALIGDGTDIISDLTPLWRGKHAFNDGFTFNANCDGSGTFDTSVECALAGGDSGLQSFIYQADGTGMTGTLRGAYLTASGGNTANTGTIQGAEIKARAGRPGETGNDVAVLEGFSVSSDAKTYDVTTHRGGEIILDGGAGTSTLAVGLRIANNFQANRATTSYGLQIYRDSFDYTADIQLSHGHTIADGANAITLNTTLSATSLAITGATGTNIITIPDNLADAWHLSDAGGLEYMRIISTNAGPAQAVVFNEGGVDVDFRVEAVGVVNALFVQGSSGQIILGLLGAGVVQSSVGGVLTSGPLPLTDLASYTQGDLIYGGAADWQDLAHPGAANRVLQSTAAEVGWSANAVTFPAAGAVPVGSGAANQVAYWSAANTLTGDAGLAVDAANDLFIVADGGGIGIGAALERIEFHTAGYVAVMGANLGVGTVTPTGFFHVENTGGASGISSAFVLNSTASFIGMHFNAPTDQNAFFEITENHVKKGSIETVAASDYTYVGAFNGHVLSLGSDAAGIARRYFNIINDGKVGLNSVTAPSTALDIGAGAIEMDEMTAPGAGAANTGRFYLVDNAGKTELYMIFATGAAQLIAAQP